MHGNGPICSTHPVDIECIQVRAAYEAATQIEETGQHIRGAALSGGEFEIGSLFIERHRAGQ